MDEKLWAGPAIKVQYAAYHYTKMAHSLDRPRDAYTVSLEASGAIIDTGWQRNIYAHLDAFLSATWSIPAIIQCCFGVDPFTRRNQQMKVWWSTLAQNEKDRRHLFNDRFKPLHNNFRALPLGPVRHTIEHRSGVAPAAVTIIGLYGVTHVGGPGDPISFFVHSWSVLSIADKLGYRCKAAFLLHAAAGGNFVPSSGQTIASPSRFTTARRSGPTAFHVVKQSALSGIGETYAARSRGPAT